VVVETGGPPSASPQFFTEARRGPTLFRYLRVLSSVAARRKRDLGSLSPDRRDFPKKSKVAYLRSERYTLILPGPHYVVRRYSRSWTAHPRIFLAPDSPQDVCGSASISLLGVTTSFRWLDAAPQPQPPVNGDLCLMKETTLPFGSSRDLEFKLRQMPPPHSLCTAPPSLS